jgi:general stress protein 26
MTAQVEKERGPIWFFTVKANGIVQQLDHGNRAIATFTSKGHDLFATVHGRLSVDTDLAVVDRFWTRFVAAWYEGGRDDPTLTLLRLDAQQAEILEESSSLVAGIKMLFGADPKQDYKDKVAKVRMR